MNNDRRAVTPTDAVATRFITNLVLAGVGGQHTYAQFVNYEGKDIVSVTLSVSEIGEEQVKEAVRRTEGVDETSVSYKTRDSSALVVQFAVNQRTKGQERTVQVKRPQTWGTTLIAISLAVIALAAAVVAWEHLHWENVLESPKILFRSPDLAAMAN